MCLPRWNNYSVYLVKTLVETSKFKIFRLKSREIWISFTSCEFTRGRPTLQKVLKTFSLELLSKSGSPKCRTTSSENCQSLNSSGDSLANELTIPLNDLPTLESRATLKVLHNKMQRTLRLAKADLH